VPIAKTIYLEPDIYRPGKSDGTDPAIRAVTDGRPRRSLRRDRPVGPRGPQAPRPASTSDSDPDSRPAN